VSITWVIAIGLAGLASAGVVVQGVRASDASRRSASAITSLEATTSSAKEVVRLRDQSQVRVFGAQPSGGFVAAVGSTLTATGLDPSVATSITKQDDRPSQDGAARVQDMRIELNQTTVAELGSFLAGWRADHPAWRVTSISIRRANNRRAASDAFQVSLVCSAEYAAEGS